jgi:glucuronokinase
MDFSQESIRMIDGFACGVYESIPLEFVPPLYIAYSDDAGEPTERFHNNLRARFDASEVSVVNAMKQFAQIAQDAREAIYNRNHDELARLMNANFDLRHSICRLPREHIEMVEVARKVGTSAKFAGSGGAIVGTDQDDEMNTNLKNSLRAIGCHVMKLNHQEI